MAIRSCGRDLRSAAIRHRPRRSRAEGVRARGVRLRSTLAQHQGPARWVREPVDAVLLPIVHLPRAVQPGMPQDAVQVEDLVTVHTRRGAWDHHERSLALGTGVVTTIRLPAIRPLHPLNPPRLDQPRVG